MSIFNRQWMKRFSWPVEDLPYLPLTIAHRGASDYRMENSIPAFSLASELFAEMWEIDVRLSADGEVVVSHDDNLARVTGRGLRISESDWSDIRAISLRGGYSIPTLRDVIEAARERNAGLYIEAKSEGSAMAAWSILRESNFSFAVIGSFNAQWIAELRAQGCTFPLSVLIPVGADPFQYSKAADPDILHLCWRDAWARPHELVTDELITRATDENRAIVIWHEDRREVLDALDKRDVLGICTNRPECLRPVPGNSDGPLLVAHRGMNFLVPENTREATRTCIDQNLAFVEVDVRTTSDGALVVIHDATLDRTTNGTGKVAGKGLDVIRSLDAGSWFSSEFSGLRVPTLGEILELARGQIGVYIEIKDADPEKVLSDVRAKNMLENVFFWSHDTEALRYIRGAEKNARLMAPRWMYPSLDAAIAAYDADIIEFELGRDDIGEVAQCHQKGVKSMIFSVSHDLDAIRQAVEAGPDLLNLDRPDLAKIIMHYPQFLRQLPKDDVVAA